MRHQRVAKKIGRSKAHRAELMASLVANLIMHDRIVTTLPKAKQARRDAEKMVTLARKGTLASRRLVASRLHINDWDNGKFKKRDTKAQFKKCAIKKLFDAIVPAMDGRPGGYTRIVKTETRRGDAAEMAVLEWVVPPKAVPVAESAAEPAQA